MTLTHARLRELLSYEPETGLFRWNVDRNHLAKKGFIAGHKEKSHGRLRIAIDGRLYLAHRLAWLYVYGEWPQMQVDHIDGNPLNNRIENLRDVPQSINQQNQRSAKRGPTRTSKYLGVTRRVHRGRERWRATIKKTMGKYVAIGYFDTEEEAHRAYQKAKATLHPGAVFADPLPTDLKP